MLDNDLSEKILSAVDARFDEQIALTTNLVAISSLPSHEFDAQTLMMREMTERGYEVDNWSFTEDELADMPGYAPAYFSFDRTFNVVGTLQGTRENARSLILNGHIDVVPVSELHRWPRDPFDPEIFNRRYHGAKPRSKYPSR